MRARTLVLLLSDMKGFTARTSGQSREENARMLALHDALLLPVLRGYGGRKIKGIGDAMLASFNSPTDGVLCAQAMQDRLAQWNASESVLLQANDNYWGVKPAIKRVLIKHVAEAGTQRLMLGQGDVDVARDLTPEDLKDFETSKDVTIAKVLKPLLLSV